MLHLHFIVNKFTVPEFHTSLDHLLIQNYMPWGPKKQALVTKTGEKTVKQRLNYGYICFRCKSQTLYKLQTMGKNIRKCDLSYTVFKS